MLWECLGLTVPTNSAIVSVVDAWLPNWNLAQRKWQPRLPSVNKRSALHILPLAGQSSGYLPFSAGQISPRRSCHMDTPHASAHDHRDMGVYPWKRTPLIRSPPGCLWRMHVWCHVYACDRVPGAPAAAFIPSHVLCCCVRSAMKRLTPLWCALSPQRSSVQFLLDLYIIRLRMYFLRVCSLMVRRSRWFIHHYTARRYITK